ncbi:MAG: beta-lactamase family protein [Clostridia bacterium]|nr:beta-lactamase family protein [Clostridia bacterium]
MDFSKLEEYTHVLREKYDIPAFDLAVSCAGKEVYRKTDGFSDSAKTKPASPKDLYICYSASKVLTGAALAKLVSEGKLSLDDEASKYIPAFADVKVGVRNEKREVIAVRDPARPILIRHLATMTAGLSYSFANPETHKAMKQKPMTARELTDWILTDPLQFDPGDSYAYSFCLDVLGGIIEERTGMRFSEYIRENFCVPLGITDLTYHVSPEQRERLTAQYRMKGKNANGGYIYEEMEKNCSYIFSDVYDSAGAGVHASVDDYMKFASALACGGVSADGIRIMSEEAVNLMRTPLLTPAQKKAYDTLGKYGTSYGLGVRTTMEPEKFGFCTPVGEFGWDGAASAYVSMYPEKKIAFYFGIQVLGFGECFQVIHHKLRELVYEAAGCPAQHRQHY